jgi:hypothetical protein
MLAPFLRWQYACDVAALRDPTRVFRDDSIGMAVTGMLLRAHGALLVHDLAGVLLREAKGKPLEMICRCMPMFLRMPQFNRVLLRLAFAAVRRKFHDQLVPLSAVGRMIMLQFVIPEMKAVAPALTNLLEQVGQAAFLSAASGSESDSEALVSVANAFAELTRLKGNYIPRFNYRPEKVTELIATYTDEIKAAVKPVGDGWTHPFVFSLQELIETIFAGADENPKERLRDAVLL